MSDSTSTKFLPIERKITALLTGLYSLRMLGIFILLPIMTLYTATLQHSTPFLTGLVFSSYALTQILLQPIFGWFSDFIGRKITLVFGLFLFVIGSLVIAFSTDIYTIIGGRILQGAGAISAVVLALATDLTREEIRSKVMAFIGVSIGLTFGLAMPLGLFLYHYWGGQGIFIFCGFLGALAILIVLFLIPSPPIKLFKREAIVWNVVMAPNIWRLYLGAFLLHFLLMITFVALPITLLTKMSLAVNHQWSIYVPSFFISLLAMGALIGIAEKRNLLKYIFLLAIILIGLSGFIFSISTHYWLGFIGLLFFFTGFNVMEASQPSLLTKFAPENRRGMIMGLFSSCQFIGTSAGGIVGAMFNRYFGQVAIYLLIILFAILWFIIATSMQNPVRRKI